MHENLICESHQVCHSLYISFQHCYSDDCKLYDMVEYWLEETYMSTFHTNNNTIKFYLLSGDCLESILPIFHPTLHHPLQWAFNQYAITGLDFFDWFH